MKIQSRHQFINMHQLHVNAAVAISANFVGKRDCFLYCSFQRHSLNFENGVTKLDHTLTMPKTTPIITKKLGILNNLNNKLAHLILRGYFSTHNLQAVSISITSQNKCDFSSTSAYSYLLLLSAEEITLTCAYLSAAVAL